MPTLTLSVDSDGAEDERQKPADPLISNPKVAANRQAFANRTVGRNRYGNVVEIGRGHIIEAKHVDTLEFFAVHHDYRKGKIREYYVPSFPQGLDLFKDATLKIGPEFVATMFQGISISYNGEDKLVQMTEFSELEGRVNKAILDNVKRMDLDVMLPLQGTVIPFLLAHPKRNLIASAPTGCGKTISIMLPMIDFCLKKVKTKQKRARNAPFVVVIAATRDLVYQLHLDLLRLSYGTNLRIQCAFGEYDRNKNGQDIREGCDILVATVGRFVDLVDKRDVSLDNICYFVMDEADKLVMDEIIKDLMIVIDHRVHTDLVYLFFSATFNTVVTDYLRRHFESKFYEISLENRGLSPSVKQTFVDMFGAVARRDWLMSFFRQHATPIPPEELKYSTENFQHKQQFCVPKTIIYGDTRRVLDLLAILLSVNGIRAISMHGGRSQKQRNDALNGFNNGVYRVLVASNVAARGLNIPDLKYIINYDPPVDFDTYVHRIGRAGRLGTAAEAITFLDHLDGKHMELAHHFVHELKRLGHPVPDFLEVMSTIIQISQ